MSRLQTLLSRFDTYTVLLLSASKMADWPTLSLSILGNAQLSGIFEINIRCITSDINSVHMEKIIIIINLFLDWNLIIVIVN